MNFVIVGRKKNITADERTFPLVRHWPSTNAIVRTVCSFAMVEVHVIATLSAVE
jgi:hypothetical protein